MFVAFVSADTQHQFNARESDWGFTSFMPLSELCGSIYVMMNADVGVSRLVHHWEYDSR